MPLPKNQDAPAMGQPPEATSTIIRKSDDESGAITNLSKSGDKSGAMTEFVSCESGCKKPGDSTSKRNFVAEAEPHAKGPHSNIKRTNLVGIVEELAAIVGPAATTLLEEARNTAELPHRKENRNRLFEIVQELATMLAAIPEPATDEPQPEAVESATAEAEAQDSPPATDEPQPEAVESATGAKRKHGDGSAHQLLNGFPGHLLGGEDRRYAQDTMYSHRQSCPKNLLTCVMGSLRREGQRLSGSELCDGGLQEAIGLFSRTNRVFVHLLDGSTLEHAVWGWELPDAPPVDLGKWERVDMYQETVLSALSAMPTAHFAIVSLGTAKLSKRAEAHGWKYDRGWKPVRYEIHLVELPATPPKSDKPDTAPAKPKRKRNGRRRKRGGAPQADAPAKGQPAPKRDERNGTADAEPSKPEDSASQSGDHPEDDALAKGQPDDHNGRHCNPAAERKLVRTREDLRIGTPAHMVKKGVLANTGLALKEALA